ncbi:hypothetical protein SprV_0401417700 [Sparganum proliferum]
MPVPRTRVHPRHLLAHRKTDKVVGQKKIAFGTGTREGVIAVAAVDLMATEYSLPGSMFRVNIGHEVTKDNQSQKEEKKKMMMMMMMMIAGR